MHVFHLRLWELIIFGLDLGHLDVENVKSEENLLIGKLNV